MWYQSQYQCTGLEDDLPQAVERLESLVRLWVAAIRNSVAQLSPSRRQLRADLAQRADNPPAGCRHVFLRPDVFQHRLRYSVGVIGGPVRVRYTEGGRMRGPSPARR
jgi:hypothetical protein